MTALQARQDGQVEIATADAEYKSSSLFLAEKTGDNGRAKDPLLSTLAAWFLHLLVTSALMSNSSQSLIVPVIFHSRSLQYLFSTAYTINYFRLLSCA